MARESPTQKAGALLQRLGFLVTITERWNAFAGVRQDAWGFVDLIAIKADCRPLYLQVTSWPNVGARVEKITTGGDDKLREMRLAAAKVLCKSRSARVEVWGFQPGRTPRTRNNLKRVAITYDGKDFELNETQCHTMDLKARQ